MSNLNRRRFLEDSLLAAAALATAPCARARAAEQQKQSKSPSERLSVAVVGAGWRGNDHLQAYAERDDIELRYIVETDEAIGQQRVAEIAKKYNRKPQFVRDVRKVFDDKSLDLVSTATPNHWHALVAIWAMQAGKDVFVEKPVGHNLSEGRRIVQAARKYSRICQAGTQCRSQWGCRDAIEYIRAGKIGEVKLARALCYKLRPSIGPRRNYQPPPSVDYDLWTGPAPLAPLTRPKFHYDWHWQWPYGNGDLGNQGVHEMDVARWGLGIDTLSTRVLSYGGRLGYEDAGDTPNTLVVAHEFADGKTLVLEVRGLKTDPLLGAKVGVIFYGSEGYVVMTAYHEGMAFDRDGKWLQNFYGKGDNFDNFIQAVRSRNRHDLHAEILEGHLSTALCHLGNISYRLGRQASVEEVKSRLAQRNSSEDAKTFDRLTAHLAANGLKPDRQKLFLGAELTFDPQSETFPGNAAANAMLSREYRKPFLVPPAGQV